MVPTEPTARSVGKNEKAKIYWNVPFILEKPPENGANKPDVIVHDKETNNWTLFEGKVCQVDKIADPFKEKQTKYIELHAGIKREYKSTSIYQINIVFDLFYSKFIQSMQVDFFSCKETLPSFFFPYRLLHFWELSYAEIVTFPGSVSSTCMYCLF